MGLVYQSLAYVSYVFLVDWLRRQFYPRRGCCCCSSRCSVASYRGGCCWSGHIRCSHYCECEDNCCCCCCYEVVVILVEMIHLRANREYHILMNSPGK